MDADHASPSFEVPTIPVRLEILHVIQIRETGEVKFSLELSNHLKEKVLVSFSLRDGRWLMGAITNGFNEVKQIQNSN